MPFSNTASLQLLAEVQKDLRAYAEDLKQRALAEGIKYEGVTVPEKLWDLFVPTYMNTAETTMQIMEDGTTFVLTGDIEAMWLRDSALQVYHYLPAARGSEAVKLAIRGLLLRQMQYILYDPYANSFNLTENDQHWDEDIPAQKPAVWEQKYEIDSLCYPFFLLDHYVSELGDRTILDEPLVQAAWATVVRLWILEQRHEENSFYYFIRHGVPEQDTLSHEGQGYPHASDVGLTWCGFRPSDDACTYPYLIPANLFAAHVLNKMVDLFDASEEVIGQVGAAALYAETGADLTRGPERVEGYEPEQGGYAAGEFAARVLADEPSLAKLKVQASRLAEEIRAGVEAAGIALHPIYGEIYSYETTGLGEQLLMDDANIPSLLALPYLDILAKNDIRYRRTRKFILSLENPYYFEGSVARGIGSPHTPEDYIWHIALNVQALTSTDPEEIQGVLEMLANSDADTGWMHEGFHKDDPTQFTRPWFAWSNSMLAANLQDLYLR